VASSDASVVTGSPPADPSRGGPPSAGTIQCPTCGATVNLEGPPGAEGGPPREGSADGEPVTTEASLEATEQQGYFSGEDTIAGVMEELEEKPGGPDGGER